MRRRVALHGATAETLALVAPLGANPDVELGAIFDEDPAAARRRWLRLDPDNAHALAHLLTDRPESLGTAAGTRYVVEGRPSPGFADTLPAAARRGIRVLTPFGARVELGGPRGERGGAERLRLVRQAVSAVDWSDDSEGCLASLLTLAIELGGAEGGSLLVLDTAGGLLELRHAVGIEPELWPRIRVPLGTGIAGRVAERGEPVRIEGPADPDAFGMDGDPGTIRRPIAASVSLPLHHDGALQGTLHVHHGRDGGAFGADPRRWLRELAHAAGPLLARVRRGPSAGAESGGPGVWDELESELAAQTPPLTRWTRVCERLAERLGGGVANLYLVPSPGDRIELAATSLGHAGPGGASIRRGQGVDGRALAAGRASFLVGPEGRLEVASLPLEGRGRIVGLLAAQLGERSQLGDDPRSALERIAARLAVDVADASDVARHETQAIRAEGLSELALPLLRSSEPGEVVREAAARARLLFDCEHVVIRLRDRPDAPFAIRACSSSAHGRAREALFRFDQGAAREAIEKGRPVSGIAEGGSDDGPRFSAWMAASLERGRERIGSVGVYEPIPRDVLAPRDFAPSDRRLLGALAGLVERALTHARAAAWLARSPGLDPETELPSQAYWQRRVTEEIGRSHERERSFAVVVCRIETSDASGRGPTTRALRAVADALRAHLRPFEVAARLDDGRFALLLPDVAPGDAEPIAGLARRIAESLRKPGAELAGDPVALSFGYAHHPQDAREREELMARAGDPRIRMV